MAVNTLKFSEFDDGGDLNNSSITVGYSSTNLQFTNPWTFLASGTTADRPTPSTAVNYRLRFNLDIQQYEFYDAVTMDWVQVASTNAFGWVEVTTSPIAVETNTGYITNSASIIGLQLPAASVVGDEFAVTGKGAGGWIILQAAGQSINIGTLASTIGAGGSVASSGQYDSLSLVCITANTIWSTRGGPQGNLTII